jgi:hypothetical protein
VKDRDRGISASIEILVTKIDHGMTTVQETITGTKAKAIVALALTTVHTVVDRDKIKEETAHRDKYETPSYF